MQALAKTLSRPASVIVPLAVIGLLLAVRCVAVFQLQANSDEAQHLHMIYGWLSGELPYETDLITTRRFCICSSCPWLHSQVKRLKSSFWHE